MKTVVDVSLAKHDDVFFQGNAHTEAIRLPYGEFARLERPLVVHMIALPVKPK